VSQEIEDEAMERFVNFIGSEDKTGALTELNAWLRQNPAHQIAWARARRISRLTVLFLDATEPGASKEEIVALLDAIATERSLSREEFADA